MATFVLVHGAWHGGWCWEKVTPLLEERGHKVYTPTLTGLAERADLLTPEVNLSTHIRDVVELFESEDLHDVVLAGHSYGGQVISGAVRHIRDRLRHVAYLDAIFSYQGEAGIQPGRDSPLRTSAIEDGEGWRIPVPPPRNGTSMGVTDPDLVNWLQDNLTDHPLATFEEPVALDDDDPYPVPGSIALCVGRGRDSSRFARNAERVRKLGWPVTEIETGHDLMVTEPQQTADFLMRALEN